jgi:hypothetical protein
LVREQNIFYGVVSSENSMTELLCNFMTFKPFRNAFVKLFFKNDSDKVCFDDFQTQYTTDINQSRPDMVISNDDCEFLVEVKTWDTRLTSNQPRSYLEHLKSIKKQYKCLVFLVPSNYSHLSEWQGKVDKWLKDNNCNITVKAVIWNKIIGIIEQNDLHEMSERFRDFHKLLKSWFEIQPITFNTLEVNYMFTSEIPAVLTKLYAIIDEVKNHFSQIFTISKSMNSEEYGIYFKRRDDKASILYLGTWYPFWEKYGFPLCYGVNIDVWPKDIVKKFTEAHKGETVNFDSFRMAHFEKSILNDEKCAEKIVNLIKAEIKMFL